jgi:3-hydroxybutyryl-CoA dehydrogenase
MTTESTESNSHLLVVGAGTMGLQIALQAALKGVEVALVDTSDVQLARARSEAEQLLSSRVTKGRISAETADASANRITWASSIGDVAEGCGWLIEAVPERLALKQEVLAEAAEVLPATAGLASNSSHIRAEVLSAGASWAPRCLNMHYFHPVLVMDLVEVVPGPQTSPAFVEAALSWANRLDRKAVLLQTAVDGFLVNRILGNASREAFTLLASGVASFTDIDVAVRRGLGWPLGPFELADLSGLDVLCDARRSRYEAHGDEGDRSTVTVLEPLVAAGRLGRKSGRGFYDYSATPPQQIPTDS